jgi:hypothetical protein
MTLTSQRTVDGLRTAIIFWGIFHFQFPQHLNTKGCLAFQDIAQKYDEALKEKKTRSLLSNKPDH